MILFPKKFVYSIESNDLDNEKLKNFLKLNNIPYTISHRYGLKWLYCTTQIYPSRNSFLDRWREE